MLIASIPFFIDDILELPKMGEIILIAYIVAVPITAGLWYKLSFKIGIKNVVVIGATVLALMGIPFLFVPGGPSGLGLTIIILFLAGLVDGAIISMKYPLFSSVVDSATLKTEKHQEGLYQGIFTFVSRLGITIRVVVFWVVQLFSGYDPDPNVSNTSLELLGLRLQMSLVPMIIMLIGLAFFWRLYQLNQEQILANIDKLQERKL
ncbi:MAG: hypothetical protein EU544_02565 [Promethearchaeota archaeon]|nr:MAG: hypothetical protein EU544_02565 [Candidatus Lokiarchaeota archaeon]